MMSCILLGSLTSDVEAMAGQFDAGLDEEGQDREPT